MVARSLRLMAISAPLIGWRGARALQQLQESGPGRGIDGLMAILGRVAAGGVDQDRLVGEPPVAVARAADAAHGVLAELVGEGKVEAGVDERRRLARARRPDQMYHGSW